MCNHHRDQSYCSDEMLKKRGRLENLQNSNLTATTIHSSDEQNAETNNLHFFLNSSQKL